MNEKKKNIRDETDQHKSEQNNSNKEAFYVQNK